MFRVWLSVVQIFILDTVLIPTIFWQISNLVNIGYYYNCYLIINYLLSDVSGVLIFFSLSSVFLISFRPDNSHDTMVLPSCISTENLWLTCGLEQNLNIIEQSWCGFHSSFLMQSVPLFAVI